MKNAKRAKRPSKAQTVSRKGKRQVNPVLDVLKNMDEEQVAMLQRIVEKDLSFGSDLFELDDPVDLFAEYLESCASGNTGDDAKAELLADLVVELSELQVASNGGNPEAREQIQAVYDLFDNAIEGHSMQPVDLLLTGRLFSDAGWAVPDSLRQAVAETLEAAPFDAQSVAGGDIVSALLEVADQTRQNPFDVFEYVNSLFASFPPDAGVVLLFELIAGNKPVINQAVAGFVLHTDAVLARSATDALAKSAKQMPVESSLIERLVRIRPWLPQARQEHLDTAIRAMRLNTLPPVKSVSPKIIKCYASICDGSGTRSLLATQRVGAHYQLATVMIKCAGVVDAIVLPALSKSEMDGIVRQFKSSMPVMEIDLSGTHRMLGLAIADNSVSGTPPPFKLVEVVESLGLGPVHPDYFSPIEIITGLLADLSPEQTDLNAVAKAHADMLDSEFKYRWFEAGEALEDLLYPVKGSKRRVAKLLKDYLPERRSFWARQCALSALAMRGVRKTHHALWVQLALVGRDIASDMPLDQIPLMNQIAEISVQAFESRL
jgi:hypothetical protein